MYAVGVVWQMDPFSHADISGPSYGSQVIQNSSVPTHRAGAHGKSVPLTGARHTVCRLSRLLALQLRRRIVFHTAKARERIPWWPRTACLGKAVGCSRNRPTKLPTGGMWFNVAKTLHSAVGRREFEPWCLTLGLQQYQSLSHWL